jgi:hypothetical protein
MSEDQTTQQMLLLEDSHANHSALQEKEKEQQMIAISGMKLLESLPNANRGGLLEKMLKDLLTSTTAWSSDRCKLIWKSKVSKSNVLLFQLQASVLGIKGKESGLWLTPTATDIATRSEEALQKRKEYRKSIGRTTTPPGNLVQYGQMFNVNGIDKEINKEQMHVSNTNDKGLQRFNSEQIAPKQKLGFTSNKNDERSKTWWQTQSEFCGVPNGISYELDKDRSNRIKALGNSIVPQIARQIGLSIMKAELN